MENLFKRYQHEFILGIFICIYIAYFTIASFLRYDNFYAGRYDLGNMDQTVWNTINGRIFQTSNENGVIISRLSAHADFLLILISPFYLLWSSPKTLLLLQTAVLGLGAIFIFLIAKEILKNKNLALIFGFLFLMNPLMQFSNLYDFHAVTFATTLLLSSFYFLIKKKYFLLTILLALSGIAKEEIWIITSFFGFPLLLQKTKIKLLGLGIIVFSLAIFVYLVNYAIPQNLRGQHFALAYFSDFGDTSTQVVLNILLSPQKLFLTIFNVNGLSYLFKLFLPLGFISFLNPFTLIFSVPSLLINLLSNNSQLREIYYQYTSTITPFIFISGIHGVKQFLKWFPKISKFYVAAYLLFFMLSYAYFLGPLPGTKNPSVDMFTKPYSNKKIIEDFLTRIPENYTVAATNNLGAHLSHRKSVATIPAGIDQAQVILFLLNDVSAQPSLLSQKEMVYSLKHNRNYVEVFEKDDFVVFKKQGFLL
ncbi:MAG: hypothetical protein A3B47_02370 [Candidatus Levybacteria bacterium RIFCSPLOWO2_01_FULL_39_24]|nr:MAG: hypothetical protein A2800_01665 [Candidatus Levybacteria bacterium RIFCSPHIGHO2_01_FULL_40_16]OGH28362.1 MAG: hypothetical protein A3E12_01765 [Candidatus Levybacteria bacterium RIFCSPHIGHO2_12_FULL_39_9]OGH46479.1 MAG: hypothetical protein A3B47_02370 [Candidatus Levybacteria bacterium RIFCSPLOWO2_01_FULL_39_24]